MFVELLPNSMSFRIVSMLDVERDSDIPADYTGRVRKSNCGTVEYVAWLTRGMLEDPDHRTPAVTRFRPGGAVKQERHYRLDRLHDPTPDVPAVRGYYADGTVHYEERFRYGRRHDSADAPAIVKWRNDGTVRTVHHYYEGLRLPRRRSIPR
jgi:hypothetical protein